MESKGSKNDLPLMANSHEIQVVHFIQDLRCDFKRQIFHGDIYLILLDPSKSGFAQRLNIHEKDMISTETSKQGWIDEHESKNVNVKNDSCKQNDSECGKNISEQDFIVKLDSHDIVYNNIEEIVLDAKMNDKILNIVQNQTACRDLCGSIIGELRSLSGKQLHFITDRWCLQIWKPGVRCSRNFPLLVRLKYETKQDGASLRWTEDQDGK